MRRFAIIFGGVIALIVLLGIGALLFLRTEAGRDLAANQIEQRLGAALGGDVSIGKVEGDLLSEFVLRDMVLSDAEGVFARAPLLRANWRPAALARGEIVVDAVLLRDAAVLRRPVFPKRETERKGRVQLSLPSNLPDFSLHSFEVANFSLDRAVTGRPVLLDAEGSARTSDGFLNLVLGASSKSDTDYIEANIKIAPEENAGDVSLLLASKADGALTALAGLKDALLIDMNGAGPLDAFTLDSDVQLGEIGALTFSISGNLALMDGATAVAEFSPGVSPPDLLAALGGPLTLKAGIEETENGVRIDIDQFAAPTGEIDGRAQVTLRDDAIDEFDILINALVNDGAFPAVEKWAGNQLTLDATGTYDRGAYTLNANLKTPRGEANLSDVSTDFANSFDGALSLEADENDTFPPPLARGFSAKGDFAWERDVRVGVSGLVIDLQDGSTLSGSGDYAFDDAAIRATGDLKLQSASISQLIDGARADGFLDLDFEATGPLARLQGRIDGRAPRIEVNDGAIPASTLDANIRRDEEHIFVEFAGRARRGDGLLSFVANANSLSSIEITRILLAGAAYRLEGDAAYDADSKSIEIDLTYAGNADAEPFPGVPLAGELSAKGAVAADNRRSNLQFSGSNIVSGELSAKSLEFTARGPANAIAVNLSARRASAPGVGELGDVTASGSVSLNDEVSIRLDQLTAQLRGARFALSEPASIVANDGVEIKRLRAVYGRYGSISIDANLSPARWTAVVSGENLPIREFTTLERVTLALDTDADLVAEGEAVFRSVIAGTDAGRVAAAIDWDGESLLIRNAADNADLRFNIDAPIRLKRTPSLGVEANGPLDGAIEFAGRLQQIAPFLPEQLATLEGDGNLSLSVGGTFGAPAINGDIRISNGSYTEPKSGLAIVEISASAQAESDENGISITFSARGRGPGQGGDTILADGEAAFGDTGRIDTTLRLNGAEFSAGPVQSVVANGTLTLSGEPESLVADGDFQIESLDANIISPPPAGLVDIDVRPVNGAPEENIDLQASAEKSLLELGLTITADDRIFIRGRGLESEWRANVTISGDAASPTIVGNMRLRRGVLDFAGRRFDVVRGEINFDRLSQNNPSLDIRAEIDTADSITAAIEISGRASSPTIELVSTPSRPPEDIMALILFGKPATSLSALESLQVAEALAQLSGVGPFGSGGGVTAMARQSLGLDLLNINLDSDAGASSLEVGKYVADGLFVSATQDARGENGAVRIEYEITDSITVETELQQDGDQTVSANWKRDF